MNLPGIGPSVAARLLVDVGDITHPDAGSSDKPLPGPATNRAKTPPHKAGWHRREPEERSC
jgi:hypothetical protein